MYAHLCNSHPKVGNGLEKREGVAILSHFDKMYVTHFLKLGMDQRREKEGVVILSHFDKIYVCNSLAKVGNGSQKRKRGSG